MRFVSILQVTTSQATSIPLPTNSASLTCEILVTCSEGVGWWTNPYDVVTCLSSIMTSTELKLNIFAFESRGIGSLPVSALHSVFSLAGVTWVMDEPSTCQ